MVLARGSIAPDSRPGAFTSKQDFSCELGAKLSSHFDYRAKLPSLHTWSIVEARAGAADAACDIAERYVGFFPSSRSDFTNCDFLYLNTDRLFESYRAWLDRQLSKK